MPVLTLGLPPRKTQTAFNLRRWTGLLADPELAKVEGRIETDRHGRIIMSPPPAPSHGSLQARIAFLLQTFLSEGCVLTECPVSTADGVKAADVAWASNERMEALGEQVCFSRAPEICVEVVSPGNTEAEIREKRALYFDAGAREVWICARTGAVSLFISNATRPARASEICPEFPRKVARR
jgi:Uma2 family endonuclease